MNKNINTQFPKLTKKQRARVQSWLEDPQKVYRLMQIAKNIIAVAARDTKREQQQEDEEKNIQDIRTHIKSNI